MITQIRGTQHTLDVVWVPDPASFVLAGQRTYWFAAGSGQDWRIVDLHIYDWTPTTAVQEYQESSFRLDGYVVGPGTPADLSYQDWFVRSAARFAEPVFTARCITRDTYGSGGPGTQVLPMRLLSPDELLLLVISGAVSNASEPGYGPCRWRITFGLQYGSARPDMPADPCCDIKLSAPLDRSPEYGALETPGLSQVLGKQTGVRTGSGRTSGGVPESDYYRPPIILATGGVTYRVAAGPPPNFGTRHAELALAVELMQAQGPAWDPDAVVCCP